MKSKNDIVKMKYEIEKINKKIMGYKLFGKDKDCYYNQDRVNYLIGKREGLKLAIRIIKG